MMLLFLTGKCEVISGADKRDQLVQLARLCIKHGSTYKQLSSEESMKSQENQLSKIILFLFAFYIVQIGMKSLATLCWAAV